MSGMTKRLQYERIDKLVRERCGNDFDYWRVADSGVVEVRMKPKAEQVNLSIGPRSYPDPITNPVDPPTVSGTDVSIDVG